MKIVVGFLILVYMVILACVGMAELNAKRAMEGQDVKFIKRAQRLNPFVADYFYREYRLSGDIHPLIQAMAMEPTKAAYHMYYGLALLKQAKRTKSSDVEAVTEICKAAKLKPYSPSYRSACASYRAVIPIPQDL